MRLHWPPGMAKTFEGKQVKHIKVAGELGFGNAESSMIAEIAV